MTVGCIEVSKAGNDFKLLLKYGVSKFAPISELRKKLIVVQVWSTLCDLADMASSSFCKLCRKGATREDLVSLPSLLTSSISYFRGTNDLWGLQVELEQVPCPTRLKVQAWWKACSNLSITGYYPGLHLGQACELFDKLDRAWKNVEYTRLDRLEPTLLITRPKLGPKAALLHTPFWEVDFPGSATANWR